MEHNQITSDIALPLTVVGKNDVSRLLREVAAVDDFLEQAAIRQPGSRLSLPRTSKLLEETLSLNQLNALRKPDRQKLTGFLEEVRSKAPVITMSFGADPSAHFVGKIMQWLRSEVDPHVLLQIGLQPNLGVGCVLRTTNKYFDFSLREQFKNHRELLISKLRTD